MHLIRSSPWLRCQKKTKKLWKTKKMPIFLSHTLALTSFCSIFQFLEHCEVWTIPQWTFPKFEKCENDAMALGDIICYKKYVRLHSTMQCLQYWLHSAFQLCVGKVNRNSGKVHTTTIFLNIILIQCLVIFLRKHLFNIKPSPPPPGFRKYFNDLWRKKAHVTMYQGG